MDETNVCASIMFITKLKHVLYALDSFLIVYCMYCPFFSPCFSIFTIVTPQITT